MNDDATAPLDQFRLTQEEALLLTLLQGWMIKQDVQSTSGKNLDRKRETQREYRRSTVEALEGLAGEHSGVGGGSDEQSPPWPVQLARAALAMPTGERTATLENLETTEPAASRVSSRARALLLLIEIVTFYPWSDKVTWGDCCRAG